MKPVKWMLISVAAGAVSFGMIFLGGWVGDEYHLPFVVGLMLSFALVLIVNAATALMARRVNATPGRFADVDLITKAHRAEAAALRKQLRGLLDGPNRRWFDLGLPIEITGSRGGKYLLFHDSIMNVRRIDYGGHLATLCANVPMQYTTNEIRTLVTMTAQVLMLTTDEDRFLQTARKVRGNDAS